MSNLKQDLNFIQVGLDEIENYLRSDEIYWLLSGSALLPRLTIGYLLLSLQRANVRGYLFADQNELITYATTLDKIRLKWHSAWERKCTREACARLDLWKNFLADYYQSPESQFGLFRQQVQWRVLLELLNAELKEDHVELALLSDLDKKLESSWCPRSFVWESDLINAFPQGKFWFLYGQLK